jgi:hypothetical protein
MNECVVVQSGHHEQSKVYAAGDVALKYGVTDVPTPHRQPLALAFLEVASANDSPPSLAGKHPSARLDLIVKIRETGNTGDPAEHLHERFELP